MRILLANDDGYSSPGIQCLKRMLEQANHEVWVVAPQSDRSTVGHSLTLHKPLRIGQVNQKEFWVSGSPADCVYMALHHLMPSPPDLVISGINRGANLGNDIFYSGTVAAAREAAIAGYKSIALSLTIAIGNKDVHWETALDVIQRVLRKIPSWPKTSYSYLLNVNVPNVPLAQLKGTQVASQGKRLYSSEVTVRQDPRGRSYYWVGGQYQGFQPESHSDCDLNHLGYATITALKINTTSDPLNEELKSWSFDK